MFTQIQGTNASVAAIKYDPVAHRFLRFQHDVAAGRVQFLTSATGADSSWSIRHMIDANVPLGAMTIELGAGVYNAGSPGVREARFDNFEYCPP